MATFWQRCHACGRLTPYGGKKDCLCAPLAETTSAKKAGPLEDGAFAKALAESQGAVSKKGRFG